MMVVTERAAMERLGCQEMAEYRYSGGLVGQQAGLLGSLVGIDLGSRRAPK
jgi:hypothetical protein